MSYPPPSAPPPSYGHQDVLMDRFRSIAARYEISDYFARKLTQLQGFEIVLILDDSGSMNTPVTAGGSSTASPFQRQQTRWDELKQTVAIIVDIAAAMDPDGLDLYFLNRATLHGVTSSEQLHAVFAQPPQGLTPITPVLQHVLQAKKTQILERKLLVLIATDGAPTNASGQVDTRSLRHVLENERNAERVYVTFLACTDDQATMSYLNAWDKQIRSCDVVDDYASEREDIQRVQGRNFAFSFGNYVVKALLGAVDPEFDRMDEQKTGACCAVQ